MRSTRVHAIGLVAALLASWAAAPAHATTVGGLQTWASGPFALVGGRLALPIYTSDNQGQAYPGPNPPTVATVGVRSFGPHVADWRSLTLTSSFDDPGYSGPPAIAADGANALVAWVDSTGLHSARLGPGLTRPTALARHVAAGALSAFDVAAGTAGARAVAWSSSVGVQLQSVSAAGVAAGAVTLSLDRTDHLTVSRDDHGGWWVLWRAGGRLRARNVTADGSAGVSLDLGPASLTRGPAAPFLAAGAEHSWVAVPDGLGGLWAGLPSELLHVTPTSVSRTLAARDGMTLAAGDGVTALVQNTRGNNLVLRRLQGAPGRAIRLPVAGFVIDVALDAARGTIEVLSGTARGGVTLTEVGARGRLRGSRTLGFCRGRRFGQVEAASGLVAVACAGQFVTQESVQTGGDYQYERTDGYFLLRGLHLVGHEYNREGEYGY